MARARNLKPGFFKDARIVACSYEARLLFQGLWCMGDYMGRLKYVPLEIKMEIFPADPVDVEKCMQELSDNGLIQIYTDRSGAALVQVTNFTKHQNPHVNERQDRNKNPLPCLPGPDDVKAQASEEGEEKPSTEQQVAQALRVLREYSESDPADSLNLIPDSLFPRTDSGDSEKSPEAGKPPKSKLTKTDLINDFGIPEELAVQFLQIRKDKRLTLTPKAMEDLVNEFGKAGLGVPMGIELCCKRSWAAFKESWDWQGVGGRGGADGRKETPQERGERMARERGLA
tara:strand:+ start:3192 stop:4049 length:858 start_codon:yes stop_codon:yes gene_type:complete